MRRRQVSIALCIRAVRQFDAARIYTKMKVIVLNRETCVSVSYTTFKHLHFVLLIS